MFKIISGDGTGGLEDLLRHLHESESETSFETIPGDFALLAERCADRQKQNTFTPGEFVQLRMPSGLGVRHTGPFVVVRTLHPPIQAATTTTDWLNSMYPHDQADIVLGMIIKSSDNAQAYREIYGWSGNLIRYDLNALEREMADQGVKNSRDDVIPPTAANTPQPATREVAEKKILRQSGWSGFPE